MVYTDQLMSEEDRMTMRSALEMFHEMTNMSQMVTRLYSRGAIGHIAWEEVNRNLKSGQNDASFCAASE